MPMPDADSAGLLVPRTEQRGNSGRTIGRPFANGRSGNPGGRPKLPAELRERAQAYAPDMIDTLYALAMDQKQTGAVRVSAAVAVLDRGYGKPTIAVAATVLTLEELVRGSMKE